MIDVENIEKDLQILVKAKGVKDVILISRGGMHIAGTVPGGAHPETFSAMFAILLGAAETASSELREKLKYVFLIFDNLKVLVVNDGPKALLVLKLEKEADEDDVLKKVDECVAKLSQHL
ncbi:MAG: roadblock/LC7 domain-containing protein [Thermoplasmata archaeon]|nr:roadblock/LC7 domain-containing protein [Thermoplasmata archaeon]